MCTRQKAGWMTNVRGLGPWDVCSKTINKPAAPYPGRWRVFKQINNNIIRIVINTNTSTYNNRNTYSSWLVKMLLPVSCCCKKDCCHFLPTH